MEETPRPDKRRKYDAVFCTKALRLAEQSRSTQATARALNDDPKRIY
jgi:transposase